MFCSNCGEKIDKDSKFCEFCGENLVDKHKIAKHVEESELHEKAPTYAGFWIRLGAYVIDFIGMMAGVFVLSYVLGFLFGEGVYEWPDIVWGYLSYVLYSTFTLSVWFATLGKHLYGLKVVTNKSQKLDFVTSLKRSLLQPLSTLFFGIGYWNMNKNKENQAWHDKQAGTIVVRKEKNLILAYIVTAIMVIVWAYLYLYA